VRVSLAVTWVVYGWLRAGGWQWSWVSLFSGLGVRVAEWRHPAPVTCRRRWGGRSTTPTTTQWARLIAQCWRRQCAGQDSTQDVLLLLSMLLLLALPMQRVCPSVCPSWSVLFTQKRSTSWCQEVQHIPAYVDRAVALLRLTVASWLKALRSNSLCNRLASWTVRRTTVHNNIGNRPA